MAKEKTPVDEKFEKQDFDLFEALAAIDRKDYDYYDRLTEEQKKKFVPYMLVMWESCVKANANIQQYYLQSTDYHANKYLLNENITGHPKLQWMMLCAASPGLGKQFHQWIPNISMRVSLLKDSAKLSDIKQYYKKIYPKTDEHTIDELAILYTTQHAKKMWIAKHYPDMKISDIEILNEFVNQSDIDEYEAQSGN
jgi:hypothetical protein